MTDDPIVEEIRRSRARMLVEHDGDLDKLMDRLKQRESEDERYLVKSPRGTRSGAAAPGFVRAVAGESLGYELRRPKPASGLPRSSIIPLDAPSRALFSGLLGAIADGDVWRAWIQKKGGAFPARPGAARRRRGAENSHAAFAAVRLEPMPV